MLPFDHGNVRENENVCKNGTPLPRNSTAASRSNPSPGIYNCPDHIHYIKKNRHCPSKFHYFFTILSLFLRHSFTISSPFFHYVSLLLSLFFHYLLPLPMLPNHKP